MSVSSPSFLSLTQMAGVGVGVGARVGFALHLPSRQFSLLQSLFSLHFSSFSHPWHRGPPQSTPVSSSSASPLLHCFVVGDQVGDVVGAAVEHLPEVALTDVLAQTWLMQSLSERQIMK
jgi:hypothetical protein